jgi:heme-degrading monooxygenase HmoA
VSAFSGEREPRSVDNRVARRAQVSSSASASGGHASRKTARSSCSPPAAHQRRQSVALLGLIAEDGTGKQEPRTRVDGRVIARIWHGWTTPENAGAYEELLRAKVFPWIGDTVEGFRGAYLMRDDSGDEVEFVTLTLFDSLDAVRAFAGDDYETAVVLPEADALLSRYDRRSRHYETLIDPS